jgi:hypothetical protein
MGLPEEGRKDLCQLTNISVGLPEGGRKDLCQLTNISVGLPDGLEGKIFASK